MFKQRRPSKSYNLGDLEAMADAAIAQEEEGEQEQKTMRRSTSGVFRRGRSDPDLFTLGNNSNEGLSKQEPAPFRRNRTEDVDIMARRARRRRGSDPRIIARTPSNPDKLSRVRGFVKRTVSNASERSQGSNGSSYRGNATFDTKPRRSSESTRRRSSRGQSPGEGLMRQLSSGSISGLLRVSSMDHSTPNASSSSLNKMANDVLRSTVMAPVAIAKTVVQAGSIASDAAVAAGTGVGDAVVYGGKSVVKAGRRASAKGLSLGADMMKRSMSMISYNSLYSKPNKSTWEEAIEAMDEILDPDCDAYQHMTPDQRTKMLKVRKVLIKGPTERQASKLQHVPAELILMQDEPSMGQDDTTFSASLAFNDAAVSSHFILEEYAGLVNQSTRQAPDPSTLEQLQEENEEDPLPPPTTVAGSVDSLTASLTDSEGSELSEDTTSEDKANAQSIMMPEGGPRNDGPFVPPEFAAMDREVQAKVFDTLRWDAMNSWDFNIFELDKLTNGHAMLFTGWAVLGAPHSQQAMAKHLGMEDLPSDGYSFYDELKMPPQKLYNFIKVIEEDYNAENPYHNSIHGADVLQSLHTLIQRSANLDFMEKCPKLNIFAILLSALVHDVSHFGTTNAFHSKLQTELAVLYNDKSVMESWHVAHAFSRMLDLDLATVNKAPAKDVTFSKLQQNKDSECNLLCNATQEQFQTIRRLMIDAILHTDMTNHFEMVNAARALLMDQNGEEGSDSCGEDSSWQILMFMLHMADISGQAKADPLFNVWRERCFEEFFAQGDQEAALGLPISPNCDRNTVVIPQSQIGFLKFVIQPAFEVLGEYIPFVQDSVLPIIHSNMLFYVGQQELITASTAVDTAKDKSKVVGSTEKNMESGGKGPSNQSKGATLMDLSRVSESSSDDDSSLGDSARSIDQSADEPVHPCPLVAN